MALHPTAQRLQERLSRLGLEADVRELSDSARTAPEAAAAVGVQVGQIVKSLVFVDAAEPLLCLCAGDRRVDTERLGTGVRRARGDEVREATGFAIGGVSPVGHHRAPPVVLVDRDLAAFDRLWAAAGSPTHVFATTPDELLRISGGAWAVVREG